MIDRCVRHAGSKLSIPAYLVTFQSGIIGLWIGRIRFRASRRFAG
jgi:hypothetical protein